MSGQKAHNDCQATMEQTPVSFPLRGNNAARATQTGDRLHIIYCPHNSIPDISSCSFNAPITIALWVRKLAATPPGI